MPDDIFEGFLQYVNIFHYVKPQTRLLMTRMIDEAMTNDQKNIFMDRVAEHAHSLTRKFKRVSESKKINKSRSRKSTKTKKGKNGNRITKGKKVVKRMIRKLRKQ